MTDSTPQYQFHTSTTDAWHAMLKACSDAKKSIYLEEYILSPDTIGTAFVDVLSRKAQEGLTVKLLLDWYGCRDLKKSEQYQRLLDSGVQVHFFRPPKWDWLMKSPRLFPRDHRKLLILDDAITFVGGVCIYDNITHWRDTMVELSGSITEQFLHTFHRMWQKVEGDERDITANPSFETSSGFSVYANAPDSNENHFVDKLIDRIKSAKHSIKLTSPYFTPGEKLLPVMQDALSRNVKLEILLSNYSKYLPYVVGKMQCGRLIEHGAHIYYYEPTMLHLKMMIIDSEWSAIGSCNLDGLSIHHNQEVMLVSVYPEFTASLDKHFEVDKSSSVRFSYADWQARPVSQKIAGCVLLPFRHYL